MILLPFILLLLGGADTMESGIGELLIGLVRQVPSLVVLSYLVYVISKRDEVVMDRGLKALQANTRAIQRLERFLSRRPPSVGAGKPQKPSER